MTDSKRDSSSTEYYKRAEFSALFCYFAEGSVKMDYKTVRAAASGSLIEKKSEFIGSIAPCADEQQALAHIERIKSENRKARHNVYAYILREGNISRYSDDGEPQGTGGIPVLETLKKVGLTDVCVVVTRYFGGILLGTGGLARAYSSACKAAVDNADIMLMCSCSRISVRCDYALYGRLTRIMPEFEVKIQSEDFGEDISLKLLVKDELAEPFKEKLVNAANGKLELYEETNLIENFA